MTGWLQQNWQAWLVQFVAMACFLAVVRLIMAGLDSAKNRRQQASHDQELARIRSLGPPPAAE